jgi:hypothetical protein
MLTRAVNPSPPPMGSDFTNSTYAMIDQSERRRMRLQFHSSWCCRLFTARTPPGRLR